MSVRCPSYGGHRRVRSRGSASRRRAHRALLDVRLNPSAPHLHGTAPADLGGGAHEGRYVEYVEYLMRMVREMRHVAAATLDDAGLPAMHIVELVGADAEGLYFAVDRASALYAQLVAGKSIAIEGMGGSSVSYSAAASLRGRVEDLGTAAAATSVGQTGLAANADGGAGDAVTLFRLYQAVGAWRERGCEDAYGASAFVRTPIRFGDDRVRAGATRRAYVITDECDGCRACVSKCPEGCIDVSSVPAVIDQNRCTRCGNCEMACFQEAIVRVK